MGVPLPSLLLPLKKSNFSFVARFQLKSILFILIFMLKKKYMQKKKNTVAWLLQYAIETNLFRLESTNAKKNPRTWMIFGGEPRPQPHFFILKMFQHFFFLQKIYIFKSVQIYVKDPWLKDTHLGLCKPPTPSSKVVEFVEHTIQNILR